MHLIAIGAAHRSGWRCGGAFSGDSGRVSGRRFAYKSFGVGDADTPTRGQDDRDRALAFELPVLSEELNGSVYLASPAPNGEPGRNPFGSLLALYIVARIPDRGILVKAAGEVTADLSTGRLVTTFDDLAPLPFDFVHVPL